MKSFIKTIMSSTLVLMLLLTNIAQVSAYHVLAKSAPTNTYSSTAAVAPKAVTDAIDQTKIVSRSSAADGKIVIQWEEAANKDHVYAVIKKDDENATTPITWSNVPSSGVLDKDTNDIYILMQKHKDLPDNDVANIQKHELTQAGSTAGAVTGAGTVDNGNTTTIGTVLTAKKDNAAVPADSLFLWTYEDGTPVATTEAYTIAPTDLGKKLMLYISGISTESGLLEATFDGTSKVSAEITKAPGVAATALTFMERNTDNIKVSALAGHEVAITDAAATDASAVTNWTKIDAETTLDKDDKDAALTENTSYKVWARVAETDSAAAGAATATEFKTAKTIQDTLTITGDAKFGVELTSSIDGATYTDSTTTYTWYRVKDGVETEIKTGTADTDKKYTTVADDIGATIKLVVSVVPSVVAADLNKEGTVGTVNAMTAAITKADAPAAPAAGPKITKTTHERITVEAAAGNEYAITEDLAADANALKYQSDTTFTGLKAETGYTLYQRVAETATALPSLASGSTSIKTNAAPTEQMTGDATLSSQTPEFGTEITVDVSAIQIAGANADAAKFLYTWDVDGTVVGTADKYTPVAGDIGKTVKVTIGHEEAANTIVLSAVVDKAAQAAPQAVNEQVLLAGFVSITEVAASGNNAAEYAITQDDTSGSIAPTEDQYQASTFFEKDTLVPGNYTIYARYAGSATEKPGAAASKKVVIVPQDKGAVEGDVILTDPTPVLNQDLEADATGITTPATPADRVVIWRREGVPVKVEAGAGTNNKYKYMVTDADAGSVISAEVRAPGHTGLQIVSANKLDKVPFVGDVAVPVATGSSSSSITFTAVDGYEYLATTEALDEAAAAAKTFSQSNVISGLNADTSYNIYQRVAETKTVKASDVKMGTAVKTLTTSSGGTGGGSGSGGGSSSGGGSGSTTTPGTGSVTHNTTISSAITKLNDAKAGDVLSIDMGSTTAIEGKLIQSLKDKGVDAILKYGTYTWSIKAADIKSVSDSNMSIDLKVTTDKKSEVSELVGGKDAVQLDIAHNGVFPFKATLEIAVDSKYNGQTLYVAYVDGSKLEYKEIAQVAGGKMKVNFDGASTYVATEDVAKGSSVKFSVDTSDSTIVPKYTNASGASVVVKQSAIKDGRLVFTAPETAKYTISNVGVSYTDVNGDHWAMPNIQFVSAREIFTGSGAGKFSPNNNMTRAEVVTTLGRLFGVEGTHSSSFKDVPTDAYYSSYVGWAASNGIVQGVGGDKFNPNGQITREELAVILVKYIGVAKMDLTATSAGLIFDDASSISSWAADSVNQAVSIGLINGKPGNKFDPKGVATRAEVSTVIARLISESVGK